MSLKARKQSEMKDGKVCARRVVGVSDRNSRFNWAVHTRKDVPTHPTTFKSPVKIL